MTLHERLLETTAALRARIGDFTPDFLLILGSGLGYLADEAQDAVAVSYADIPHFKTSTAPGHAGRLVFGTLAGRKVCLMQGRFHQYEGHSMADSAYPVYTAKMLGATYLIVTNASGGVNLGFTPGDLMLITDQIKLSYVSPLTGENAPELGVRFPDMSTAYSPELLDTARRAAEHLVLPVKEGVYMYFPGPQFETAAEIRAARTLGADAVGMSTVAEVIAAAHCGLETLGIALISNMGTGVAQHKFTEGEVIAMGNAARPRFSSLILRCLETI